MKTSLENEQKNIEDAGSQSFPSRPPTPDHNYQLALRALKILLDAGYRSRFAGGCVRDRLLGSPPKDYDIATEALPEQICLIFAQKGLKTVPTGVEHGTVTVVLNGLGIEVTTLRRDVETYGRRAKVLFGSSFRDDAARRDFTINAMFEDENTQLFDYFDGLADMQNKRLRFVGEARERIREDYLRILRFFRFWARFQFTPEPTTLEAIAEEVEGLKTLSQERICSEWMQILDEPLIYPIVAAMKQAGVFQVLLGWTPSDSILDRIDAYKIIKKTERSIARTALLLLEHDKKDQIDLFLKQFRLSSRHVHKVQQLLTSPSESVLNDLATQMQELDKWERSWPTDLPEALKAWGIMYPESKVPTQLAETESRWGHRRHQAVPIKGGLLQQKFPLTPGPLLGELLKELLRSFRNGDWQTEQEGLELAERWLNHTGWKPKS